MILLDVNLLLDAYNPSFKDHERARVRGPLIMDAHLAALAIEHGAVLCTTDRDFARFPNLKVRNPLLT